jgi:hypothetical protein
MSALRRTQAGTLDERTQDVKPISGSSANPLAEPELVQPAFPVELVDVQEILGLDDRQRGLLDVDIRFIIVIDIEITNA